jgi:dimethylaniline monooxygenase (N-oxide forming)
MRATSIRFNCEVTAVAKDRLGWRVTTVQNGEQDTRYFGAVIVANGHLWDPRWPSFSGAFSGSVIHSSQYRTAQPFDDKKGAGGRHRQFRGRYRGRPVQTR